ncbi:hypothetical protein [Companilactobacillus sp. HBUAS59699]|uniref:hypothetical protein n=1 Tax=Companilactobacillus sp. HBUAS59699 TaxID=3109358 RepID=UPI002FF09014
MTKLKSYRPFITENFLWEFPSHFKLKEASEFLNLSIAQTTDFISHTAKSIMRDTSIYWFIQDKETKNIAAFVSIENIGDSIGNLTVQVNDLNDIEKKEIAERLIMFVKDQIKLNRLQFVTLDSVIQENFTKNGYNIGNKELKRS